MCRLENSGLTIEINGLRFTYPGIDGHPPPGSKPLIDDFSLTLNAGDRCLLVGSNGAGSFIHFSSLCHIVWLPRMLNAEKKIPLDAIKYITFVFVRE